MGKQLQPIGREESRREFLGNAVVGLSAMALGTYLNTTLRAQGQQPRSQAVVGQGVQRFGLMIHGGVGVMARSEMTSKLEKSYRAALEDALSAGYSVLKKEGSSLDAVEAAIKIMEDSPLFNAGKGAVFTNAGTNELDASIMDGKTLKAGAVSTLKHIKNPISLARLVMERSPHVMMVGEGAEEFAKQQGMGLVPQKYFYTERRWKEWQQIKGEEKRSNNPSKKRGRGKQRLAGDLGTVGAVALDKAGNLAAGTSTGGLTNKRFGRVGDSPILGAGTYADNQTCAVSATGDGEYFIRLAAAHDISAMLAYRGIPVDDAASAVIEKVGKLGGTGGVIAIDRGGNMAMPFNTEGMYRGYVGADGKPVIKIYEE